MSNRGRAGDHRVTALADWNGERATLDDRMNADKSSASRDNVGAAVQHQMLWRRLATTAGARVEHNDSFGTAVVPRGSAVVALRQRPAASATRACARRPDSGSRSRRCFRASARRHTSREPGPRAGTIAHGRVRCRAAFRRGSRQGGRHLVRQQLPDIIGLRSTGSFTSEYFNIGLTRARGAELSGELAPHPTLRIRAATPSSTPKSWRARRSSARCLPWDSRHSGGRATRDSCRDRGRGSASRRTSRAW